ncbi:MAG: hypothetical protein ACXVQY_07130 [Actinomycetota bacterium]
MGLMDKVKAAAQEAAAAAKKGTAQVQEKVEQAQLRKKADEAAKQLGYLIVRERTKGEPAGAEADRLVNEVVGFEAQLTQTDEGSGEQPASPPTSASEPAAGDFKLD